MIMGTPAHVFIMAAIIAGTIFLLLLDNYKRYQTDISIIVIPKSTVTIIDHEMIVYNVKSFPTTLTFYNRLLADNTSINDEAAGKSNDQRKKAWNRKISTKTSKNDKGSIVTLRLFGKTAQESQDLAVKSAQTLFAVTSKYYNIKDDINLHVIDQPITKPANSFVYAFAIASLIIGFILAWLVEKFFVSVESKFKHQSTPRTSMIHDQLRNLKQSITRADIKIKSIADIYKEEVKIDEVEALEKKEQEKKRVEQLENARLKSMYPNFPEMPVHRQAASAPSNLPIGEDIDEAPEAADANETQEDDVNHMKDHEPTEEELKRRLNQLLRGEM